MSLFTRSIIHLSRGACKHPLVLRNSAFSGVSLDFITLSIDRHPARPVSTAMGMMSRVVCVLVVLAMVINTLEAAKIETFNSASCVGSPTNTFKVGHHTCQIFEDQGAVRISEISSGTRVSIHNQQFCEQASSVAQIYGPGCVVQGGTPLRAVWID